MRGSYLFSTVCGLLVPGVWLAILVASPMTPATVSPQTVEKRYDPLDQILDTHVREGLVYYRALKADRAPLDAFIRTLDVPDTARAAWPVAEQQAFWINGYNALVLRTVINAYPIQGPAAAYPSSSIRQIPGAFERVQHAIAGEALTLDQIETKIAAFGDARLLLAQGRGAIGSPRLRSEAYRADRLEAQLSAVVKECADRRTCATIDRAANTLTMNPLMGWQAASFERTYPDTAGRWPTRSGIERAVLTMLLPHLLPGERDVIAGNTFEMKYGTFDWTLNDLTGR